MSNVMLAKKYDGFNPTGWWMSEKYDGVRAVWDGENFISRNGKIFSVPDELKAEMPDCHLDGEFWMERGLFQKTAGIVRRKAENLSDWQDIKYMVFDAPKHFETFEQRQRVLESLDLPDWCKVVPQRQCQSQEQFQYLYDELIKNGAEGVVLRKARSFYENGRSDNFVKVVPMHTAEAIVIGYKPGSGKYSNVVGSLVCRTVSAVKFAVGGLSALQKKKPPKIGVPITYSYKGLTSAGVPRQPNFVGIRDYE